MDADAESFFCETAKMRPTGLTELRGRLDRFIAGAAKQRRRVALVTSGGTTAPLELNTVRFVDNFSTGTRGARCTEGLLGAGYSAVFLHRQGSNFPFATEVVKALREEPLRLVSGTPLGTPCPMSPETLSGVLLPVAYTTIFDYLFLLREACQSIRATGFSALVVLAAAVADFYVPESEMVTDKIQSRAHDGLSVQLRNVPKLLGAIKAWTPEAFLLSFKLETNPNILAAKAAGAIFKYGVDAVCANVLQDIRDAVTIVSRDPAASAIEMGSDAIEGTQTEPVAVGGIISRRVERGSNADVDTPLVRVIAGLHDAWVVKHGGAREPASKRAKAGAVDE